MSCESADFKPRSGVGHVRPFPPASLTLRRHDWRALGVILLFASSTLALDVRSASAQSEGEAAAEAVEISTDPDQASAGEAAAVESESHETQTASSEIEQNEALADAETPEITEERSGGIEVIRIEAQRRSQNLQKAPVSISSFSGSDILDQGLEDFNDLQYNVPNLFSGSGLTKITLRGVGGEIVGPGIDPGFAVHVNNIFSSRESTGLIDFFDIERVDVMRGPQGTLSGRNSTGGAVNIITARAVHHYDASADAEFQSFKEGAEGVRFRGMFNIPLIEDKLAVRVAFLSYFNDGITVNEHPTNKQRLNDAGTLSLRTSFRWEPDEDVTVDLIGTVYRSNNAGGSPKFEGDFISAPDPQSTGVQAGSNFDGALPNPTNPYRSTADERQDSKASIYSLTLIAGWQADSFKLDSFTGFQSTEFSLHRDQDGSSLPISTLDLVDSSRQLSQEFVVNSSWDWPVNYTVGANYQYDWTPRTEIFIPNFADTADSASFNRNLSVDTWIANQFNPPNPFVDGCGLKGDPSNPPECQDNIKAGVISESFTRAKTKVKNHVVGIFGNLRWEVMEDLTLNAGGRFSYTHRDWNDSTRAQSFVGIFPRTSLSKFGLQILQLGVPQARSWQSGTWKLSADYQITSDHLVWTSVGTGSRAGGFNFAEESSFGAERILSVEGGIKTIFFDHHLLLNLTGFWYDWDDPQIGSTVDSLPVTVNAPSAETYGVEVEWQALPIDNLEFDGSFGWLEATYDKKFLTRDTSVQDFTAPITSRTTEVNIKGNRLPRSPRFTASVGAQYTFYLDDYGSFTPRVDFYYRDKVAFRQFNNPKDIESSYTRTDARITWRSESGKIWVELFVRNLEDEHVKTNQERSESIYRKYYYDEPRSTGVRVGYFFE